MAQSRKMLILRAVIEDYIRSQEPVGSSALAHHHDLGVSSATIRNDMAALEEEGYLIQPHTSAGRIPTEHGYRYFVDRLSTAVSLSEAQRRGIRKFLSNSISLQDTLQRAARILAGITGQVAVISSPSLSKSTLRHIELVPLATSQLLAVVITDAGGVAQHTLKVPRIPSQHDLDALCSTINARCTGLLLSRASRIIRALDGDATMRQWRPVSQALAEALQNMADNEQTADLYMAGTSRLVHQHAVYDLAPLFDALEEQVVLMKLMSALSEEHEGVRVAIGSETHNPGLLNAAVITSGYGGQDSRQTPVETNSTAVDDAGGRDSAPVAFVGSIGPTHMNYSETMAAVRAVARYLSELLAHGEESERF